MLGVGPGGVQAASPVTTTTTVGRDEEEARQHTQTLQPLHADELSAPAAFPPPHKSSFDSEAKFASCS